MAKPILKEVPESFETERLLIRMPKPGDGPTLNAAVIESLENLRPWMPWARNVPTLEESETTVRNAWIKYLAREDFMLLLFLKGTDTLVGGSGLHVRNENYWDVPKFEIGYWVRQSCEGKGFIGEAVAGITKFGFEILGARRIEIRCDERNSRSRHVAERTGYKLDALFVNDGVDTSGQIRNTLIFSQTR